jgi:hypothetical protein
MSVGARDAVISGQEKSTLKGTQRALFPILHGSPGVGNKRRETGTALYVAPNESVVQALGHGFSRARVVAFNPGLCGGAYAYRSLDWYFPQHGQSFNPSLSVPESYLCPAR